MFSMGVVGMIVQVFGDLESDGIEDLVKELKVMV